MLLAVSFAFSADYKSLVESQWGERTGKIMLNCEGNEIIDSLYRLPKGTKRELLIGEYLYAKGLYRTAIKHLLSSGDPLGALLASNCYRVLGKADSALAVCPKSVPPYLAGMQAFIMGVPQQGYWVNFIGKKKPDSLKIAAGKWTIQFGAFSERQRADFLAEKVRRQESLATKVVKREIGGRMLFLVWGGVFDTKADAEKVATTLSSEFVYRIKKIKGEK